MLHPALASRCLPASAHDVRAGVVQIYNLNSPAQPHKELESPLKYQTRCITCFPDHTGFMVRSCPAPC